ncbi:myo-inositol-1(or 4)-monophosphatase [Motilibacter rhizosphaerae]|uniref:Inositol-1-monophosphatase n=1 Tax=Motilibacter rhizosphaerae TaxID=598652 RepID=A0A4Q7NGL5_9ACTN|nr:inositol monophosphatase family protein [Motilibacter rhizosphaerae]RZS82972.1 myo-inositol-1(or 4)-monophosphatase [Motilibacter rhizosphaerae]
MTPAPEDLLATALRAAAAATRFLVEDRPADLRVLSKSTPTDPVTEMDRASERLVVDTVRAERPEDGFFGEEGADSAGTSGVVWVIDPIDGTVNYLYGLPQWSVSIAAELDGQVVAGVVAAPLLGEVYSATLGGGGFVETAEGRRRLRATPDVALDRALVATGFGYAAERRRAQGAVVAGLLPLVRDIRRNGSAALDVCGVAAGRFDAYYERGVNRWDTAAAALVAREAGVHVAGLRGATDSPELTVAAPRPLFDALAAELERLGADSD